MSENTHISRRYWLHAVTPIHLGSGRGLGYIDLPVAREAVTKWPYLPGSSVKGVIAGRARAEMRDKDDAGAKRRLVWAFGPEKVDEDNGTAGSLVFTDAHILCLPVRSFFGTFAWVTSPFALTRFVRDGGLQEELAETVKELAVSSQSAIVTPESVLTENGAGDKIYLEDLDLTVCKTNDKVKLLAHRIAKAVFAGDSEWQAEFVKRFAVISDDIFSFLCETGTEVNAHIRIDDKTGVVRKGALWYEETLPGETILSGMVWCEKVYVAKKNSEEKNVPTPKALLDAYCVNNDHLQIGGKASTGKGIVRLVYESAEEGKADAC